MNKQLALIWLVPALVQIQIGCKAKRPSQSPNSPASKSEGDLIARVDSWVWDAALFARDKSLVDLRKLAPVIREASFTRTEKSDEGERVIVLRTLQYDGLEITGVVDGDKFILDGIVITNPRWQVPNGLNVGTPGNQVPPVFGLPPRDLKSPDELFSGLACSVSFRTNAGRISRVSYAFFSD